ncbi:MAG: glycosyltransferase family 4 protein [Deltaproteobacteria bacterium]|nr:glycosyltransferase family 4 protein [Deltaproteobacteria bacterium]
MKILIVADVAPDQVGGGGERVLRAQLRGLADRGHAVTLLYRRGEGKPTEAGELLRGIQTLSYPVTRAHAAGFAFSSIARAWSCYRQLSAREDFDVIIFHQPFSALGVLLAAARDTPRKVYTFHSSAAEESQLRIGEDQLHPEGFRSKPRASLLHQMEHFCLRHCDLVCVLSEFSRQKVQSRFRIPADRIAKIPGGVDTARFYPIADRKAVRRRLSLPVDRPLLLSVRNLVNRMGLENLLLAMRPVVSFCPQVLLIIGGAGPLAGKLKGMTAQLGLADHVRFLGLISDIDLPCYYQTADFFILPTRALEGFGLVTVEALACGTPVLATPIGATPELLGGLEKTLLFSGTAPEAIAQGIVTNLQRFAAEPQDYEALRQHCWTTVKARFGWERVIGQWEAELGKLVNHAVGRS